MAYIIQGVYCSQHRTRTGYPLLSTHYEYQVGDCAVMATLKETYRAETNVEREILYMFEIPPEASVVGFSAEIGNTKIKANVEEKGVANEKYQKAIKDGVQAWKLDKVNDEVFTISLGHASPNSSITIHIRYAYLISSDTIDDSLRLTIPAGLASRAGGDPRRVSIMPTAPTGSNAVTITVGIDSVLDGTQILGLNSLSHHATITNGFSDESFNDMTPTQQAQKYDSRKAYVKFTSKEFLKSHFVLVWAVPNIDHARCSVELLKSPSGKMPQTSAFALTLVSNIKLEPEEHEYIFVVDSSGSMSGQRSQTANNVLKTMLNNLPTEKKSTFNIYRFNDKAWSIIPGGRSVGYDTNNVSTAISLLETRPSGGTSISTALAKVLGERNTSKPRCSIIVLTDGLDWGVTTAMQTIQKSAAAAAANSTLLRVFVIGLGDDVSRNMCEALARAGSGATAYISESQLQAQDHQEQKAWTMINSINRAPIRVRSIDWGMTPTPAQPSASGNHMDYRPKPDQHQLGAAAKGDNLPPPKVIQQAPLPGTMFWAIRSYWFAIIQGAHPNPPPKVKIIYDIPGSAKSTRAIEVTTTAAPAGKVQHCLAARALIQTLEDDAISITGDDKYWNECEIIRLGKTYGLASTQTSFIATINDVSTISRVDRNAPLDAGRSLSSITASLSNGSDLTFVNTQTAGLTRSIATTSTRGAAYAGGMASARSAEADSFSSGTVFFSLDSRGAEKIVDNDFVAVTRGGVEDERLSEILAAQDAEGAFDESIVERIIFPSVGIPAVPAFIAVLEGRGYIKDRIWHVICVIAFLRKRYADQRSEWATVQSKAEKFIKTTLDCIFNIDSDRAQSILDDSLDDAENYFY